MKLCNHSYPFQPCSSLCITPEGAAVDIYLHLAADLDRKSPAPAAWLDSLQVALQGAVGVPDHVTLLVAGACIWGAKSGTLERALEVLTTVCKLHPEQVILHRIPKGPYPLEQCTIGRRELGDSCRPIPVRGTQSVVKY